jgi:hypothetical protein
MELARERSKHRGRQGKGKGRAVVGPTSPHRPARCPDRAPGPPPPELAPGAGVVRSPAASSTTSMGGAAMLVFLGGEIISSWKGGRASVDPPLAKFTLVDPRFFVRGSTR